MQPDRKRFLAAMLTLVGTIIGVGIFGIPYALSKAGAAAAILYFVVLGGIQLLQHLFYAEAAIASEERLRLVGLVGKYIGPRTRHVAAVALVLGFWGGMLAYMLVGGTFLHALFGPALGGSEHAYQVGWAIAGAGIVYFGLSFVSRIDVFATIGLIFALVVIFVAGVPHVSLANITWPAGGDLFLPYGVILFSLSGLPAIPEMEDIIGGKARAYRLAIIAGTLVAIALTAGFGFMVWGIAGSGITQASAAGLADALGRGIAVTVAAFGFLAVATSFFATAINLQDTFEYDYRLTRPTAWLLTVGVPLAVFSLGAKDFVAVIGFSGAVFGGITAVLVALLYAAVAKGKFVKEDPLGVPLWTAYASIALLTAGAAYETWKSVFAFLH